MRLTALLVLNILLSSVAYGAEGRFTFLGEGECAVYEGGLFDPPAIAKMIVIVEDIHTACGLKIEYELDKIGTQHQLEIQNHHIAYQALQQKYNILEQSTNTQITELQETLNRVSPDNKWWWFAGGVAAGMASTYGAYKVFNE